VPECAPEGWLFTIVTNTHQNYTLCEKILCRALALGLRSLRDEHCHQHLNNGLLAFVHMSHEQELVARLALSIPSARLARTASVTNFHHFFRISSKQPKIYTDPKLFTYTCTITIITCKGFTRLNTKPNACCFIQETAADYTACLQHLFQPLHVGPYNTELMPQNMSCSVIFQML
jgi:hypothetical protein